MSTQIFPGNGLNISRFFLNQPCFTAKQKNNYFGMAINIIIVVSGKTRNPFKWRRQPCRGIQDRKRGSFSNDRFMPL